MLATILHFGMKISLEKEEPRIDINTFQGELKGESATRKSFDACNRCIDSSEKEDGWYHSEKTELRKVDQSMREKKEKLKEYTYRKN